MPHEKTEKHLIKSSKSLPNEVVSQEKRGRFKSFFRWSPNSNVTLHSPGIGPKRFFKDPTSLPKVRELEKNLFKSQKNSHEKPDQRSLVSCSTLFSFEETIETFSDYEKKLEDALTRLRNTAQHENENAETLKILRFLEHLIHQPKEWMSGIKLKLSEMKFPEIALSLMNSYREKGYLVRQVVFMYSILLYNAISNFTDHEFDKEGLIRKQSADAGFIEFACEVLNDTSYRESLKRSYILHNPEETMINEDFHNYQKILYICDSALTILYNLANIPELKIHFRECNAMTIVAEYTKLSTNAFRIELTEANESQEFINDMKELQDFASAVRVTSCLLLALIMNEDEDNFLAANTCDVLPSLSEMIQSYKSEDQRFYGFSIIELIDGFSKLMVCGRKYTFVDQHIVELLLNILEGCSRNNALIECITNAILNASFDEKVQNLLQSNRALQIIRSMKEKSNSHLVEKNCDAILWTINHIPHKSISAIGDSCESQGHIMISYNRSSMATCLKIRDRLKALKYKVWLDVDNINGGVLQSMAQAVEDSYIVLICMNEQYKQSYYCRLEAEYATELRKECIPCLMQARFRPYGWLGIIKGANLHIDFAKSPFDEAFPLLVREIETRVQKLKLDTKADTFATKTKQIWYHDPTIKNSSVENEGNTIVDLSDPRNQFPQDEEPLSIIDWDTSAVQNWLQCSNLSHLSSLFANINGKLLHQLYKMKESSSSAYFKFLGKYFDRLSTIQMHDTLQFDYELEQLFKNIK